MGKIKKVPTERHNATASPAITEFVAEATSIPLHQLSAKLAEFPPHWPHPRGDLYHWISLLDRFDHIFELFIQEYGLNKGPQTQPFRRTLLLKGDAEEGKPYPSAGAQEKELDDLAYPGDGDRELVEVILRFTRLLLERCGNRSLYASSGQINDLLHTTSLSLLQACLQLSLRLAQRYQVAKFKNTHPAAQASLLNNHYNISLDNVHKLALPINKPRASEQFYAKQKDKSASATAFNPADLVAIVKNDFPAHVKHELSTVTVIYTEASEPAVQSDARIADDAPGTPTPLRRQTSLPSASQQPGTANATTMTDTTTSFDTSSPTNQPKTYEISASDVASTEAHDLVREGMSKVPKEHQYELLQKIRIAKAFATGGSIVEILLNIRLLAISNLAYALSESKFQDRIGLPDSNEARQYHLAPQLCDLLQPLSNGQRLLAVTSETIVLETIEALARCKHKFAEIVDALSVTVNHGVLYYELRHAIASLKVEVDPTAEEEIQRTQWRNAVFDLVTTVSQINSHVKCAEKMVAAGIIEMFVEALTLRTSSAERVFEKIMGFLTSFIHGISTAFQALASARGLEIITELASYEVTLAMQRVRDGEGMPERSKSKVVDYSIPYYQQATLRSVFKFVVYLFDHNSGVHDRLLRNLLDSPQTLSALREIIGNANIFGSNVWDAAINTVTNFIHNEPTSFQVIAEAGLAKGILEAVTQRPILEGSGVPDHDEIEVIDGEIQYPEAPGILPVSETICDIPTAFGAICLNEDGMTMFLSSGALDAYLNIFLSPPHVRALEEEGQTAFSIGNAFDELSRHHPGLQEAILEAVIRVLLRLNSLASLPQNSSSATLHTTQSSEVLDPGVNLSDDAVSEAAVKALTSRAPAVPFITAVFKFLEGFFHNSTMCQKFCANGAISLVLDLITSAAMPYDLSSFPVIGKMANVVNRMTEEKPHLVLPELLSRITEATDQVAGFANFEEKESYFKHFTDPTFMQTADETRNIAKALANVSALCIILSRVINTPSYYGARGNSNNHHLVNMNFADVYVRLIQGLGTLRSTSVVEEKVLLAAMPADWKQYSETAAQVRNVDANGIIHTNSHCAHCDYVGMEGRQSFTDGFKGVDAASKLLAFKNSRLLRYMLGQIPVGIESFFQAVSQVVASKRTADSLQKHHSAVIADSLASAVMRWFIQPSLSSLAPGIVLKYLSSNLTVLNKIFLRTASSMDSFGSKEACTLVLLKFHNAGGFHHLHEYQTKLVGLLSETDADDRTMRNLLEQCLDILLSFYVNMCRVKCINDATQSGLITVRQIEQADYFMPSQFLVELRHTIIQNVAEVWKSDDVTKIGVHNVKRIIEIMRNVLKAEGEDRAVKRSDKATKRITSSPPQFQRRNASNLDKLITAGCPPDLAREAIYRCYNNESQASEYWEHVVDHGAPRFPAPDGIAALAPAAATSNEDQTMEDSNAQAGESSSSAEHRPDQENQDSDHEMSDDENLGSLGPLPEDIARQDIAQMGDASLFPRSMLDDSTVSRAAKDTQQTFITVEDLNDERDKLRSDLIDRCLEVLSVESTVTFDLAELVQGAVPKPSEGGASRADWGNTLVSSLLSLQFDESGEAAGQKISAYAHLVALILQDTDFFAATLEELKDNFNAFVSWVKLAPEQNAENAPWIEMVLLIVERILAEDEKPVDMLFIAPPSEGPFEPAPQPALPDPVVTGESRAELFDALVDLLPKIGKQQSLALSVSRILVILTRRRELAKRFSNKLHMSRLFLMVRQLAEPISEKLQSSFMLILRHLIEDDDSIRQTMKTGIQLAFETTRSGARGLDTTMYARTLHHFILRNRELFLEVTDEMVEIINYAGLPNRAQHLALKKPVPQATDKSVQQPDAQSDENMSDSRHISTANANDGVIQYLLRELSNYREVEDKATPVKPIVQASNSNGEVASSASADPVPAPEPDKNERLVFEPKDNMIYIYRCFILQCLSELVGCYSRTKLEFINFSRKAESQVATPSKPRSGTINYLLNQLLPVGTLEHRDSIDHRKKLATAEWATTLLVALCSQTHETPYYEKNPLRDSALAQESPDLAFVRKFVLQHAIRSFEEAMTNAEPQDMRYSRLLALADFFDRMLSQKVDRNNPVQTALFVHQSLQIGRLMYEKKFVATLTASIAELDLNFANAKRAVKHILSPLKTLTALAVDLSQRGELSSTDSASSMDEDGISYSSTTSVSDDEAAAEEREQTPDLFRNSTLSMFEASGQHPDESESEAEEDDDDDDDDDQEMFEAGFDDEMEYEDGNGETISDEDDEDIQGMEGMEDMGDIEGLPGDMQMEVEIVEDDSDAEDDDDNSQDDESQDDDGDDEDPDEYYDELEEVNGDDENASLGEMQEGVWEENVEFERALPVDDSQSQDGEPNALDQLARIVRGSDVEGLVHAELGGLDANGEFFEDEMNPEDDGQEGEEEDYDAGEFGYEPEVEDEEDEEMQLTLDWGAHLQQTAAFRRSARAHQSQHPHLFMPPDDRADRTFTRLRSHLGRLNRGSAHQLPRGEDEGVNPLLQRNDQGMLGRNRDALAGLPSFIPAFTRPGFGGGAGSAEMFQEFVAAMDRGAAGHANNAPQFAVTMDTGNGMGNLPRSLARILDPSSAPWRENPGAPFLQQDGRSSIGEEALAVDLKPALTTVRWEEEARILFGIKAVENACYVVNTLLSILVPTAMEAKHIKDTETALRQKNEEQARKEAQKVEAEKAEREAQEQKEREEEQARLAVEAATEESEEPNTNAVGDDTQMSGIDAEQPTAEAAVAQSEPAAPRITAMIRGSEIDITNLGIDHEYLLALPEEFREEVIMSQVAEHRSQAHQAGEAPSDFSREFLEALPPDIQADIARQEAIDRSRRERDEARRQATNAGPAQPAQAQDMDAGDFLAMLEPTLRQQILMEAHEDENYFNQLPEEFQREVRAAHGDPRPQNGLNRLNQPRLVNIGGRNGPEIPVPDKIRARPVVQMLDKCGVATLLRLMFITLHQSAKSSLRGILSDVCKNTQNRAEVISILLSILQDGTADVNAVERSFAQLSLRAKHAHVKTPQPPKRSLTSQLIQPATELSPLNIVQQCLSTLNVLSSDNPKVQAFFLTEHETLASQKSKVSKKGKTKESTAIKYPLNALLSLLDRQLITDNTGVMETLAALLSRVTSPLQILLKKAKQAQNTAEQAETTENTVSTADQMEVSLADVRMQEVPAEAPQDAAEADKPEETDKKKRSVREIVAPSVPEENIRLVVNILAARECPSKTFSDTLDIIKHMAAIPGAKEVFGRELIRQASDLGGDVVADLNDLTHQINDAQNGADVQGMALVSFSSAGSKQRKLLRILVALDHLFDSKRMAVFQSGSASADVKLKEDILASLYESDTFQNLWKDLSNCLTAIRERGDLVNVATVLLPLIESLMVVCRNSALKDAALATSQAEVTASTPPPEARIEGLFFTFTEEHRKILNELIRNNPKLMNGNLSILAKNSKVLEFDNKRSYFTRKLHNRGSETRVQHPALTLNVRRDEVFHDSYKALFFKSGEEIKNGKLNIRFNGEEGIDAGGVSREWFAVMARQMFNPDFALFNPVASDRTTFHPNRLSDINEEHLPFFKFIGRVIGKALYEGRVLDCHFSRAVYRRILGKSVSLKDMESLDLEYYKSLVWILENDITDIAFETFSVEVDRFGEVEVVDLIENGRNIPVTEDNKQEYVRLVVEHRLIKSVEEQLKSFLKGFHDIIPAELVSIFNEQELELLISGLPDIDVDDWKNNTEYHNYQATSAQIQWFWRAIKSFDPEERAKLLQFVTGTSKVPLNGFKELEGMNGFARFNIHRDYSSKDKLPTSHTCFNQLDLPEYESYEHLRQRLYTAITAGSEYFGFA